MLMNSKHWLFALGCTAGLLAFVVVDRCFAQDEEKEEEAEQPWSLSADATYLSRYTSYGADLSEDEPALQVGAEIQHSSGARFGVEAIGRIGSNGGYQQSSFHLGYERDVAGVVSLGGVYTYYSYSSDTISVLAGISNSLGLSASLKLAPVTITAGYILFFGNASANYFSGTVAGAWSFGKLSVGPSVQATVASQTVDVALLPKNRGKGLGKASAPGQMKNGHGSGSPSSNSTSSTESITGLSGLNVSVALSYPLGGGFTCSLSPAFEYSPSDLGVRTSQFIISAGLGYSL